MSEPILLIQIGLGLELGKDACSGLEHPSTLSFMSIRTATTGMKQWNPRDEVPVKPSTIFSKRWICTENNFSCSIFFSLFMFCLCTVQNLRPIRAEKGIVY